MEDGKVKPTTMKQKRWVKEYVKTGNATKAAKKIYDVSSYRSAAAIGSENLKKLDISQILENNGVTDDLIASTIRQAMRAKGERHTPEWTARLKATELASKIKGHLKDRVDITSGGIPFPIYGGKSKPKPAEEV